MILLKICVHGQKNNEECERDAEVLIDASKRAGKQKPQHKFIKSESLVQKHILNKIGSTKYFPVNQIALDQIKLFSL